MLIFDLADDAADDAGVPLQQSAAYARTLALLGAGVVRAGLGRPAQPAGRALVLRRGWGRFGLSLLSRGPVWDGATDAGRRRAGLAALAGRYGPLLVTGPDPGCGLRLAASRRLALLDLAAAEPARRARLLPAWRNHLCRAEEAGLTVLSRSATAEDIRRIHALEGEQRRRRGYRGLPCRFTLAFAAANPGGVRACFAARDGVAVAAMLFLVHGAGASYHLAWSGPAARATGAHRLLLWRAMGDLAALGVGRLDLGLAPPANPGLSAFKRGTGATLHETGPTTLHPGLFGRGRSG